MLISSEAPVCKVVSCCCMNQLVCAADQLSASQLSQATLTADESHFVCSTSGCRPMTTHHRMYEVVDWNVDLASCTVVHYEILKSYENQ